MVLVLILDSQNLCVHQRNLYINFNHINSDCINFLLYNLCSHYCLDIFAWITWWPNTTQYNWYPGSSFTLYCPPQDTYRQFQKRFLLDGVEVCKHCNAFLRTKEVLFEYPIKKNVINNCSTFLHKIHASKVLSNQFLMTQLGAPILASLHLLISTFHSSANIQVKLDGVGPVDNRPSTD